ARRGPLRRVGRAPERPRGRGAPQRRRQGRRPGAPRRAPAPGGLGAHGVRAAQLRDRPEGRGGGDPRDLRRLRSVLCGRRGRRVLGDDPGRLPPRGRVQRLRTSRAHRPRGRGGRVITFILLAVLAVIVLLVVLKVVVSIASAIFVPLLLITIG